MFVGQVMSKHQSQSEIFDKSNLVAGSPVSSAKVWREHDPVASFANESFMQGVLGPTQRLPKCELFLMT